MKSHIRDIGTFRILKTMCRCVCVCVCVCVKPNANYAVDSCDTE